MPKAKYIVNIENDLPREFDEIFAALDYASRQMYIGKNIDDYYETLKSGNTFRFSYGFKNGEIVPVGTYVSDSTINFSPEMLSTLKETVDSLQVLQNKVKTLLDKIGE